MRREEINNLPSGYVVCDCYEVTFGEIMEAIDNGHTTIESLSHETYASYACELCESKKLDKSADRAVHLDEILEYAMSK